MNQSFYLIAGLGQTGFSIARYLGRRGLDFAVFDTRERPPALAEFSREFPQAPVYLQHFPVDQLNAVNALITSPGVSLDADVFQRALAQGIAVYGDIECLARETRAEVIAITGTNGKSTATTLVGEMAKAAGRHVAVAGNIGSTVLDLLDNGQDYDLWVLELSSFQLELIHSLKPKGAAILNISPDHLDRHHSFERYKAAKQRIYRRAETMVYNRDDKNTLPPDAEGMSEFGRVVSYGAGEPAENHWGLRSVGGKIFLARGGYNVLAVEQLAIKGRHNWMNALAACALAETAGISVGHMVDVLQSFGGLPHRCQWVRTLDGLDWINDSKGTNVGATIAAVAGIGEAIAGKIILIAGGQGKGADFSELKAALQKHVRALVLIGEDADKIAALFSGDLPILRANSMEEAVAMARQQGKDKDVVLLSPACASFDMFRDFNHRGEVFTSLVKGL